MANRGSTFAVRLVETRLLTVYVTASSAAAAVREAERAWENTEHRAEFPFDVESATLIENAGMARNRVVWPKQRKRRKRGD